MSGIGSEARFRFNSLHGVAKQYGLGDLLDSNKTFLPEGDVLYVDGTNGSDLASRDGQTWDQSFKTIVYAISRASSYDAIYIGPGTYEDEQIIIDVQGLKLFGCDTSNNHYKTLLYSDAAYPMIQISAHEVEIAHLGFAHAYADTTIELGKANADACYKVHIHDCKFDGWGTATAAIKEYDSTCDTPDLHVENCLFRSYAGDVIYSNYTRARYNDNIILVEANYSGITHVPTAAGRPDTIIAGNKIIGANSGDTGIEVVNAPTAGMLIVYDNYVMNCATSITQGATHTGFCNNYVGGDAGGTLFDPIA